MFMFCSLVPKLGIVPAWSASRWTLVLKKSGRNPKRDQVHCPIEVAEHAAK